MAVKVEPFKQKIIDIKRGFTHAYEILFRLTLENIIIPCSPEKVISYIERFGSLEDFELTILEKALEKANGDMLFFNISPKNLNERFLIEAIKLVNIYNGKVVFEITESAPLKDLKLAEDLMTQFKSDHVKFAIDDFGSGYTSFSYLERLPVDYIKIDGKYIKSLPHSQKTFSLVKTFVQLANTIGVKTVAEYVENKTILNIVKDLGFDYAQGFYIDEPKPFVHKKEKELSYYEPSI
mgnify:CR=1 FL=1